MPNALFTAGSMGNDPASVLAAARAARGRISFGYPGTASQGHLALAPMSQATGTEWLAVSFHHHMGRLVRAHELADHRDRGKRTLSLHAQSHLPRHDRQPRWARIAFDSLWLVVTLVPFVLVIRYGVVAREEACLELKFGEIDRGYRPRVRRWL